MQDGLRECWLRAPTPSALLRMRPGSETMYARVVEPAGPAVGETLILGSGLCLEFELLALAHDPGRRLAAMGWRVIEPISPYHGLRAMPGFYGGEPFFALAPTGSLDLIAGQALETALLTAWARGHVGGRIAVGGISMSSFVAQQVASHCSLWSVEARPDAVLLISHSGRIEDVTFGGELAASFGIDRALRTAGWSREALARLSMAIDPSEAPALAPSRIVSVLGETDRWVPYGERAGGGAAMEAAGGQHLPLSARPSRHAGAAHARSGTVRAAQAGVARSVVTPEISRISLLRTARPKSSKLSAEIMKEPGPPITFSS